MQAERNPVCRGPRPSRSPACPNKKRPGADRGQRRRPASPARRSTREPVVVNLPARSPSHRGQPARRAAGNRPGCDLGMTFRPPVATTTPASSATSTTSKGEGSSRLSILVQTGHRETSNGPQKSRTSTSGKTRMPTRRRSMGKCLQRLGFGLMRFPSPPSSISSVLKQSEARPLGPWRFTARRVQGQAVRVGEEREPLPRVLVDPHRLHDQALPSRSRTASSMSATSKARCLRPHASG